MSSVFQELLRYFNGIIISTSFVPQFPVCPVICYLKLNKILLLLLARKSIKLLLFSRTGSPLSTVLPQKSWWFWITTTIFY